MEFVVILLFVYATIIMVTTDIGDAIADRIRHGKSHTREEKGE